VKQTAEKAILHATSGENSKNSVHMERYLILAFRGNTLPNGDRFIDDECLAIFDHRPFQWPRALSRCPLPFDKWSKHRATIKRNCDQEHLSVRIVCTISHRGIRYQARRYISLSAIALHFYLADIQRHRRAYFVYAIYLSNASTLTYALNFLRNIEITV
jgi:hypothetical protein